jgi:hypothetical protein
MRRSLVILATLASGALVAAAVLIAIELRGSDSEATPRAATPAAPAADGSAPPPKGAVENCRSRSEADFGRPFEDPRNLIVGPLVLVGGAEFTPPSVVRSVNGQKYPVLVRADHRVQIVVPQEARSFAGLGYGALPQGEITLKAAHKAVTFIACPADEPSFSGVRATVGATTFWSGFVVAHEPHCVPLDVYVDDDPAAHRIVLELGVRPCPGTEAQV